MVVMIFSACSSPNSPTLLGMGGDVSLLQEKVGVKRGFVILFVCELDEINEKISWKLGGTTIDMVVT